MSPAAAGVETPSARVGIAALARNYSGRLAGWGLAWLGAVVLAQVLVAFAPGDAIDTLPDPALREQLSAEWGLGTPVYLRVFRGTAGVLAGDLGSSWTVQPGAPVGDAVVGAMCASLPVLGAAWALAVGVGAAARGRKGAGIARAMSAVPVVLLALCVPGGVNALAWKGMAEGWWTRPAFFALPVEGGAVRDLLLVGVLGLGSAAMAEVAARLAEADARLEEAGFLLAARAHGADERALRRLRWRHRVVPLVEAAQAVFTPLVGGLVVVERLFARPGAGDLLWRAVELRDVPLATGVVVALTGTTVVVGASLDLLRRAWDPRLRMGA